MGNYLDTERLATMVRTKRAARGLREAALEAGDISPSTLSRVENGKPPDMETFLLLCDWLRVPPSEFFGNTAGEKRHGAEDASEAMAIHLRADKTLDPATANALAALVKAAYRDLAHSGGSDLEAK